MSPDPADQSPAPPPEDQCEAASDAGAKAQRDSATTLEEFFAEPHGRRNYEYLLVIACRGMWRVPKPVRRVEDPVDIVQAVLEQFVGNGESPPRRKLPPGVLVVKVLMKEIKHALFLRIGLVRTQTDDGKRHYRPDPYAPRFEEISSVESELPGNPESEDPFLVEVGQGYQEFRDGIPDRHLRELLDLAMEYGFNKSAVLARALSTTVSDIESRKKRLRRYCWQASKAYAEESAK